MLVSEVIDRAYSEFLYPAGINRPAYDTLLSDIGAGDITFSTSGRLTRIPRDALIEIGDELMLVKSTSGAQVVVAERGHRETDAAPHSAGDIVRLDPTFSRQSVINAINSVIGLLWPWGIYARDSEVTTFSSRSVKQLPVGGKRILSILVRLLGATEQYRHLKRYRGDFIVYNEFDPPKYQLVRGGGEGDEITISYAREPQQITSEDDDLTVAGVPSTLQPYLPMAVAGYLLQGREVPRAQIEEIRRALASEGVQMPPGAILNVGQALMNTFRTVYISAERHRLAELDPSEMELVY